MDAATLAGSQLHASFGGVEVPAEMLRGGSLRCRVPRALRQDAHSVELFLTLGGGRAISDRVMFAYVPPAAAAPAASGVAAGGDGPASHQQQPQWQQGAGSSAGGQQGSGLTGLLPYLSLGAHSPACSSWERSTGAAGPAAAGPAATAALAPGPAWESGVAERDVSMLPAAEAYCDSYPGGSAWQHQPGVPSEHMAAAAASVPASAAVAGQAQRGRGGAQAAAPAVLPPPAPCSGSAGAGGDQQQLAPPSIAPAGGLAAELATNNLDSGPGSSHLFLLDPAPTTPEGMDGVSGADGATLVASSEQLRPVVGRAQAASCSQRAEQQPSVVLPCSLPLQPGGHDLLPAPAGSGIAAADGQTLAARPAGSSCGEAPTGPAALAHSGRSAAGALAPVDSSSDGADASAAQAAGLSMAPTGPAAPALSGRSAAGTLAPAGSSSGGSDADAAKAAWLSTAPTGPAAPASGSTSGGTDAGAALAASLSKLQLGAPAAARPAVQPLKQPSEQQAITLQPAWDGSGQRQGSSEASTRPASGAGGAAQAAGGGGGGIQAPAGCSAAAGGNAGTGQLAVRPVATIGEEAAAFIRWGWLFQHDISY